MALIVCPECKKEVSDQAQVCPNCAYPIQKAQTPSQPHAQIIEQTSKRFKVQQIWATIAFFIGLVLLLFMQANPAVGSVGGLIMLGCLGWLIVIRLLIWWHHK